MCSLLIDLSAISGIFCAIDSYGWQFLKMTISQVETTTARQLTLDFSEGFFVPEPLAASRNVTRTIVFPKHINVPNFGRFQRQVNLLFAPLAISVEFRLTRQKRLEMKWIFPPSTKPVPSSKHQRKMPSDNVASDLSNEELKAFESLVFAMAGTH